jgi:hypothetical protein
MPRLLDIGQYWLKTTISTQRKQNRLYRVYTCMDKIVAGGFSIHRGRQYEDTSAVVELGGHGRGLGIHAAGAAEN